MRKNRKEALLIIAGCLLLLANSAFAQLPPADTIKLPKGNIIIQPVFHGALVLTLGNSTIYVDPYNDIHAYRGLAIPDLILITDIHRDHLDTATINAINTSKARFIVPQAVAENLPVRIKGRETVLKNGESITELGISVSAVPMYDLPADLKARHTKGRGNGYIIEFAGKRIYISGDTDDIPEMRTLKSIDVAFVCMNQPFTMTIQQATSAVLAFKPKIVYPYHYRDMNGFSDVAAFKKLVLQGTNNIDVRLRNWYTETASANRITRLENVVYGMVSGASLTMDIYKPEHSNKRAIITIPGTAYGYAYSAEYSQSSMTENFANDTAYFGKYARMLAEKGYTLFVLNHRLSPLFRYTDIFADCQRAVRFIRFNAKKYDIDAGQLGAFGYSSGATLCSMLGVTDREVNSNQTGIDAVSSKVQAVVTLAARFDLSDFNKQEDTAIQNTIIAKVLYNYIGELPIVENSNYTLAGKYAEASPVTYVSQGDAPFLIYASYDDPLVPHRQESNMYKKLVGSGVDARIKLSNREGHSPIPDMVEIDQWFLRYLKPG